MLFFSPLSKPKLVFETKKFHIGSSPNSIAHLDHPLANWLCSSTASTAYSRRSSCESGHHQCLQNPPVNSQFAMEILDHFLSEIYVCKNWWFFLQSDENVFPRGLPITVNHHRSITIQSPLNHHSITINHHEVTIKSLRYCHMDVGPPVAGRRGRGAGSFQHLWWGPWPSPCSESLWEPNLGNVQESRGYSNMGLIIMIL